MRFIIRDNYNGKPISGVVVKPNLLGDSLLSNEKGILRIKLERKYFDTVCITAKGYYPLTVKIAPGMAGRPKNVFLTSASLSLDTIIKQTGEKQRNNFNIADGYVYHTNLKEPLVGVSVCLDSGQVIAYTNSKGFYTVEIPKSINNLVLKYPGFESKEVQAAFTRSYVLKPEAYSKKDIFDSRYKNVLSLSLLELFQGGISVRYERFLKTKHSVGLLSTVYFFNRESPSYSSVYPEEDESMFGITGEKFNGIKVSPFYRYYAYRNHKISGYVEAKVPFGYFSFPSLIYGYNHGYTR